MRFKRNNSLQLVCFEINKYEETSLTVILYQSLKLQIMQQPQN